MHTLLAQLNVTWYLLPLAAAISLVYNASRYEDPQRILKRAGKHFMTILVVMALILGLLIAVAYNL